MAIIKEYQCAAHGDFEAAEPHCPHGCGYGMVERVFRTPISIQTQGFRNMNATFKDVAQEQGMSDMDQRGGDGMIRTDWRARRRIAEAGEMLAHKKGNGAGQFMPVTSHFSVSGTPVSASSVVNNSADSRNYGGGIYKDPQTGKSLVGAGIALNNPNPSLAAPSFDGRKLGTPGE